MTDPISVLRDWLTTAVGEALPEQPTSPALDSLEDTLDVHVPDDLRRYFRVIGPYLTRAEHGLFYGMTALPLDPGWGPELARASAHWPPVEAVEPPGTLRPVPFDPAWVLLAHDHGGAYLAADLRPGPAGRVGQIISCGPRDTRRLQLAVSLTEFLTDLLWHAARGTVQVEREAGRLDVWFTDPEVTHPIDLCLQRGAAALRRG
ncbi:SMI1/KNR4 family protein [Deinococcus kurensis]|uniref:SMI1/KNR4 family protein n=1 Tax=Deinococcus kurensis TaxID=2662757 RepID=UPI0012D362F0|nr:SMI1/KNR4 family protein [Deinococcus kurensis]